jgi:methylglutaconyl-CoA hydratase
VATVTLDSPHNRNALSSRLLGELAVALDQARDDPGVRVVVLTGAGPVFCSGADLSERLHPPADQPVTMPEVLARIARLPLPVVVRVNGHVRAGGLGLVAAGDLAVAPVSATFALTEVRVGVAPAMVAVPVLGVMDRRAFYRFALTGETFDAAQAALSGLLTEAVDDDALDAWVDRAVAALLEGSPTALAATKGLADLVGGLGWDEAMAAAAALSGELFASPEAAEGMAAFLEKRRPAWTRDR